MANIPSAMVVTDAPRSVSTFVAPPSPPAVGVFGGARQRAAPLPRELGPFLDALGLGHYLTALHGEDVKDLDTLRLLDANDLRDVGFPIGARAKLLNAFGKL